MTVTPGIVWQYLEAINASDTATAFMYRNPSLIAGDPPAVTMPAGYVLHTSALAIGSASNVIDFTASCPAGSSVFTVASNFAELENGMPVICSTPGLIQGGVQILGLAEPGGSDIVLGGGYGPWGYNVNPWIYKMPADQALTTATTLQAIDEYPYGTLGVTVSPSTGVTVADQNMDGGDVAPDPTPGNGTAMSNSGGQAMGWFTVTFASAGSYTVTVAYTPVNNVLLNPDDPVYGTATSTLSVTVV